MYNGFSEDRVYEFNSGVLLINNARLKEDPKISDKLLKLGLDPNFDNGDQTIINHYFRGKIGTLPIKYNFQIGYDKMAFWINKSNLRKLLNDTKNPVIIHYLMDDKPFNMLSTGRLREKWWFYHNLELSKIVQKFTIFDSTEIKLNNTWKKELFIFTRSAIIQNIEELIRQLPDYHFNIAAWTGMGWALEKLIKYPNVTLFPYIIDQKLDSLIDKTDIYLDINDYGKADNVIENVEAKNIPVLSFKDTADNKNDYSKYTIFQNDQISNMIELIKK